MTSDEETIKTALEYAKRHKKEIAEKYASLAEYPASALPISIFMGGSPGAGKTEVANKLANLFEEWIGLHCVRIDADQLRAEFPGYSGANAHLFQQAATRLVHEIHSLALKHGQSFIMDGTFSAFQLQAENIRRSLKRNREVTVCFVHQSPEAAWRFVGLRARAEGRSVPTEAFVRKYLDSRQVATAIKREFGNQVRLNLVAKNDDGSDKFRRANIDSLDNYVPGAYNEDMLLEIVGRK